MQQPRPDGHLVDVSRPFVVLLGMLLPSGPTTRVQMSLEDVWEFDGASRPQFEYLSTPRSVVELVQQMAADGDNPEEVDALVANGLAVVLGRGLEQDLEALRDLVLIPLCTYTERSPDEPGNVVQLADGSHLPVSASTLVAMDAGDADVDVATALTAFATAGMPVAAALPLLYEDLPQVLTKHAAFLSRGSDSRSRGAGTL